MQRDHGVPIVLRSFTELDELDSFVERFRYLALRGTVGEQTFGWDRWINQDFYQSRQWRQVRNHVINRDDGCDLATPGYEIHSRLYIHHMNPMSADDIVNGREEILDPEFLITTTHQTHNAIHYGDERQLPRPFVPRSAGDTKLW
jgi:hypothetical protein